MYVRCTCEKIVYGTSIQDVLKTCSYLYSFTVVFYFSKHPLWTFLDGRSERFACFGQHGFNRRHYSRFNAQCSCQAWNIFTLPQTTFNDILKIVWCVEGCICIWIESLKSVSYEIIIFIYVKRQLILCKSWITCIIKEVKWDLQGLYQ